MSFAQTTAADGIPTVLQNGRPELHIVDATIPGFVASVTFATSKSFAISPPPGKYHVIGSAQLETTLAGSTVGISVRYDGIIMTQQATISPSTNFSVIPISGSLIVTDAAQLLDFQVYSSAGGARVDAIDLILIRVA